MPKPGYRSAADQSLSWRWDAMNIFDYKMVEERRLQVSNSFFSQNCRDAMNIFDYKMVEERRLQEIAKEKETHLKQSFKPQASDCGGMVRQWDKLLPELLVLIFSYCSFEEKLCVIPSVCKSWRRLVDDPCCWQEIDIMKWSTNRNVYKQTRMRMLTMLLTRYSPALLKTLSICCVDDEDIFSLIANHSQKIETLKIPMSFMKDSIVIKNASKLSNLRFLDLSFCLYIGAPALEAIGKHCKYLIGLRRTLEFPMKGDYCLDEEAFAIAATMPNLESLEIPNLWFTSYEPVLTILASCTHLKFLDVVGCYCVSRQQNGEYNLIPHFLQRRYPDVDIRPCTRMTKETELKLQMLTLDLVHGGGNSADEEETQHTLPCLDVAIRV